MTQRQMHYFTTVCECGNVTKAAEQLFVSRPVVSRVLRDLEDEVGATLFIRTNAGILLTEQGSAMRKFIEGFSTSYNLLIDRMRELDPPEGTQILRIGVSPTNIRWFFPNFYYPLKSLHKNLRLFVSELPAQDAVDAVINGDVDFSITPRKSDDGFALNALRLFESESVFCASASSKYAGMATVDFEEVAKLPVVMPHIVGSESFLPNPIMFITQSDVMRLAVKGGEVYSVLPLDVVMDWEDICIIPFEPKKTFDVNLIWNEAIPHKKSFYTVLEYAKEMFLDESGA